MPNWCNNTLLVQGSKNEVHSFIEKAKGKIQKYAHSEKEKQVRLHHPGAFDDEDAAEEVEECLCFNSLHPIPDDVLAQGYDPAGYDWEMKNWGCKWGSCEARHYPAEKEGKYWQVEYQFDTAWGPPIEFFDKVAADFPNLVFTISFVEPGMCFQGTADWQQGKQTSFNQDEIDEYEDNE